MSYFCPFPPKVTFPGCSEEFLFPLAKIRNIYHAGNQLVIFLSLFRDYPYFIYVCHKFIYICDGKGKCESDFGLGENRRLYDGHIEVYPDSSNHHISARGVVGSRVDDVRGGNCRSIALVFIQYFYFEFYK